MLNGAYQARVDILTAGIDHKFYPKFMSDKICDQSLISMNFTQAKLIISAEKKTLKNFESLRAIC